MLGQDTHFKDKTLAQTTQFHALLLIPGKNQWSFYVQVYSICLFQEQQQLEHLKIDLSQHYFFGSNNMKKARISNITQTKNGTETEKIKKRRKWIKYLQQHSSNINIPNKERQKLIKWVEKTKISQSTIDNIITDNTR